MKEQILHLDPLDDYHSARDKIGWVQTDRVLLVWPPRGRVRSLRRQIDLLLLQRHAGRLGARLALVTSDPPVCDHAEALGIPVFDSVADSHLQPWRGRRPLAPARQPRARPDPDAAAPILTVRRPKFLDSGWFRLATGSAVFSAAVAALLVMLALTVPGATITLVPQGQTLSATMAITADPAQGRADPATGTIPARVVSVTVTGSAEVSTTGTIDEATERARGQVTFTNLTAQAVRIPAGTALRTTGGTPVRFVTQQDVDLEARRGSTGKAPVLAIDPGPLGNIGAGLINSIEGPLAVQAAVVNEAATTGGEVRQAASVTEDDRDRAREVLLTQLRQQGYAQLLAGLKETEFAPVSTLRVAKVLDQTYDHFPGEKADRLRLEMRAQVSATVVDEAQAFAVGEAEIRSRLGDSLVLAPGTLAFSRDPASTADEEGRVRFDITAGAEAGALIDAEAVRRAARWRLAEQAPDALYQTLPVTSRPEVRVWPSWFWRLPWLAWRIEVEIRPGRG